MTLPGHGWLGRRSDACPVDLALGRDRGPRRGRPAFRDRPGRRHAACSSLGSTERNCSIACRNGGQVRLGLLHQAPAAFGLELQLLPQRRELLDQVDDPETPAAAGHWPPGPSRNPAFHLSASTRAVFEPVAKPIENRLDLTGRSWRVCPREQHIDRRPDLAQPCLQIGGDRLKRGVLGLQPEELLAESTGRVAEGRIRRMNTHPGTG